MGPVLFLILTYYAFGLSLLAGLSGGGLHQPREARRHLGLLFLTDLKGCDVVLGKLITVGLSALYGLVAVLLVTALPLFLGGVTVREYWRVALALVTALFFALAIGILVSLFSRSQPSHGQHSWFASNHGCDFADRGWPALVCQYARAMVVCRFSLSPFIRSSVECNRCLMARLTLLDVPGRLLIYSHG